MDRAMVYKIRVEGHLSYHWSEWFCHGGAKPKVELTHLQNGETVIRGDLPDPAALPRVLMKILDLGLSVISIVAVKREPAGDSQTEGLLKHIQTGAEQ